jgi:hypothetical protein
VNLRRSGDPEGVLVDQYRQQEQDDGVAVIEWLARQLWRDGNVGMTGISWGGFNALQISATSPPSLKAIIIEDIEVGDHLGLRSMPRQRRLRLGAGGPH